jgi:long-subunit acyl-CoA synthetase (AMP-forming)
MRRDFSGNAPVFHTVDYDFTNLVEMQIKSCEIHQKENFLGTLVNGKFEYITFGEFGTQVDKFRGVLAVHKIGVNDKVRISIPPVL